MRYAPLVAAVLAAAVLAPVAATADRMWIGFHDDPVLRYDENRLSEMELATSTNHASILRTLVTWADVAPTRPTSAANPNDPAYRFDDLDEFVRNAQTSGAEVLMTIWGTPGWANNNKGRNFLPRSITDFRNFTRAVASRYSGRTAGIPFVRFYGIWNESNLGQFLSPQFNAKGKIVSPALYAKLAAAGIAGLKSGSPAALVAIGETSSNGRDKKKAGASDSVRPGTFARLLAQRARKLKFDAWAQHPYPVPVKAKATQKVQWPNVAMTSLPRFEKALDSWFKRKNIPIWITEYGSETKPGEPNGVTRGQQALYLRQAIAMAQKDQRVAMFIWFVMRDSGGSPWQSGIYDKSGTTKPSQPRFAAAAAPLSPVNSVLRLKGGVKNPAVTIYLRSFCANNTPGAVVGIDSRTTLGGETVAYSQPQLLLRADCTVSFRITDITVVKGKTYTVDVQANTSVGNLADRQITIIGV